MRNDTRVLFNQYLDRQAQLNGVGSAVEKFTVEPSVQQTLETKIQESSEFLGKVNIIGVDELKGDKLGLGVTGPIASRTNTETTDRATKDVLTLDTKGYECKKTDYDTHIKYRTIDVWAKFKDFQTRLRNAIIARCALDRMLIGFRGTSAAATTNIGTNPLLQDVNIGWLQQIRANAAARVMDEGAEEGVVSIGEGGDYKNLDALVYDAHKTLLDPWYRDDPGLVAIVGRNLMHDKLFPLVSNPEAPTEMLAADIVRSQRRLGGLPGATVPYFPDNTILITRFDNLSIYYQNGARRRAVIDNPKRDRIEHYESSNDAYVIEDYGLCTLIENVQPVEA
ncbi:phage major capsid protein, P2 family [Hydrogenophaga sp.]|uniref:phage major capsid protein, P2 family n=1 Tax=Hydrogenophaga sp. TaxID=1904254 RepID=UPI003F6F970D